jgi:hypothetical protein
MRELYSLEKEVAVLKAKAAEGTIRYRMKDSSIIALTGNESEAYQAWVFNNASTEYRASDGSKLHCLTQSVQGTLDAPFESWEAFKQRGGDWLMIEVAEA